MSATHRAVETTAVIFIISIIINFLTVSEACIGVFSNRARASKTGPWKAFISPRLNATAGEGRQASGAPTAGEVRGEKLVAPHSGGSDGREASGAPQRGKLGETS